MEEDYGLLELEDPEEPVAIIPIKLFPEEKVNKEQLEIVPVTKDDLN